jgi:hypothetical protein
MSDNPLDEIRRWTDILEASKRTVICAAEHEAAVREAVESNNVGGLFKVQASDALPEGWIVAVDEQGIAANFRQNLTRPMTFDNPAATWETDYAALKRAIVERGAQAWTPPQAERSDPEGEQ